MAGVNLEGQKDGGGKAELSFSQDQRAKVDAETNLSAHFISLRDGLAFNIYSEDDDAAAGDFVCYIKNTSKTRNFFVDIVRFSSENAATVKVHEVTGTASGTSLTPFNMNLQSGVSAELTAFGNAAVSGLTSSAVFAADRVAANTGSIIPFDDILILGTDDAIAVEYDTGTTGDCEVLIRGYFKTRV